MECEGVGTAFLCPFSCITRGLVGFRRLPLREKPCHLLVGAEKAELKLQLPLEYFWIDGTVPYRAVVFDIILCISQNLWKYIQLKK